MQSVQAPVFRDIVLVGGGHTHALLIRKWGMNPLPGVRLTLVSPQPLTPYSGMLPGLIAGHYTFDDIHIDLVHLCHWAGVRFVQACASGLDPENKRVRLDGRPDLAYDLVSLDTGSAPDTGLPGAGEHAVSIKPIASFWQRWQALLASLRKAEAARRIVVVGGGAGAVESILAMAWNCHQHENLPISPDFHLVFQGDTILPGYPSRVRKAAETACTRLGISLHEDFRVSTISSDRITAEQGGTLETDFVLLCTQAGAPPWPRQSGLQCHDAGFVEVNEHLQAVNQPAVFAAGDIAHMMQSPRPKAGVYAVRQAPVLLANLQAAIQGKSLQPYNPQNSFLSLLSLGTKMAAGNRGILSITGYWVWRWKDHIDRKFMARFRELPPEMDMPAIAAIPPGIVPANEADEILDPARRCAGCGGKIGGGILAAALQEVTGKWQPEDASVMPWPAAELVQTTDTLKAPFDDPFLFGRVAVFHALNDLLAMNAKPHSIQVSVTLPFAGRQAQQRELAGVLQGILSACQEEQVELLGGHSNEGAELVVSITANGEAGNPVYAKTGARPGDLLVTNKALGTGIILAGLMTGETRGADMAAALASMNRSNRQALEQLRQVEVHCATDISGFGLLGHLAEMLADTNLSVNLDPEQLPIQPGIRKLLAAGVRPSLVPQNAGLVSKRAWTQPLQDDWRWPILLDPQTSGGLLAAIPGHCREELTGTDFSVIGGFA